MILGRDLILKKVNENSLIENFSEKCLGGAGYDLRVDRVFLSECGGSLGADSRVTPEVKEIDSDIHTIKPGEYVLIQTLEKVNMPTDIAARVLPRSSLFRCGCALINALVDPGYNGSLTFGLKNLSAYEFILERKARVSQIIFEEVAGKTSNYSGRYQGGKVV